VIFGAVFFRFIAGLASHPLSVERGIPRAADAPEMPPYFETYR
jgi:hypothetical protein